VLPSIPKASFEETLGKNVVPSKCSGCGSCVAVCPYNCLEYADGKPRLSKECNSCGICSQICPRYNFSKLVLERLVFGREKREGEDFGIYKSLIIAQTKDANVMRVCQDGGVVTTLLIFALRKGIIDSAALSGVSEIEPLRPMPRLAVTEADVLECSGTRYTYSPNIFAFKEGVNQRKEKIAFVGTPCQIEAIRRIQALPLKKFSNRLTFTIGLFCSECFTYDGLVKEFIHGKLGVDPSEVRKISIKGKLIVAKNSGEIKTAPLKDIKQYADRCVYSCSDFSAELSDISVGGLGLEGWTLTILRTEQGKELFEEAEASGLIRTRPFKEEEKVLDLLTKLSRKKREDYERHIQFSM
jgi:coenzyme F420 hydrogenase subunit beta